MIIRVEKAKPKDFKSIHALIREFAEFQNSQHRVSISLDLMTKQAYYFNCYIARNERNEIIGYTSYSIIYYSWVGKSIYLDDIYVKPSFRGKGIGTKLFNKIFDEAKRERCNRIRWQVSKWNSSAIGFYKKIGAIVDDTELNCDLLFSDIRNQIPRN